MKVIKLKEYMGLFFGTAIVLNNKIHNMEGPAVIKKDGTKLYYIKGELLTDINDDESLKRYINLSLFK